MYKHKVIIIGAGISGLAAALQLIENGINDILIIEASERIGGRVLTHCVDHHFLDLGPQFVCGKENNPLYVLCKPMDLLISETKKLTPETIVYSTQDGTQISPKLIEQFLAKIDECFIKFELKASRLLKHQEKSVGSLMDPLFASLLQELKPTLTNNQLEIMRALYNNEIKLEKAEKGYNSHDDLSAKGHFAFHTCAGEMQKFRFGYQQLLAYFLTQIPNKKIVLNQKVLNINWPTKPYGISTRLNNGKNKPPDQTVIIRTHDSTNNHEFVYYCDHVICTMPLGYLKEHHMDIFSPKLPALKIQSIKNLGLGVVNKIFLIFDQELVTNSQGFQILWTSRDINLSSLKKWNLTRLNSDFYKQTTLFEIVSNECKNVLVTHISGDDAILIETIEEDALKDVFSELLRVAFPKLSLPTLSRVICSKWSSNEFTKGSYSFITNTCSIKDIECLAQEINNCVYFAGEHTSIRYGSTAHGAYETGLREANKIVNRFIESDDAIHVKKNDLK